MTRPLGSWDCPVQPWPSDVERWARFCSEVVDRIEDARAWSGFGHWGYTFTPPIPPSNEPVVRAIGPVYGAARPYLRHDERGRFLRKEE